MAMNSEMFAIMVISWPNIFLLMKYTEFLYIIVIISYASAPGGAAPVEISIIPAYSLVEKGGEIAVNITIDPLNESITAAQFNLLFNSSVIEIRTIEEGGLFGQKGANTIFRPGIINNSDGTLVNTWGLIITPGENITTKAALATITFYAKDIGNSTLNLSNVIVSDPSSQELNASITSASILVYPQPSIHREKSGTTSGGSSGGGGGGISGEDFNNIQLKEKYDHFIFKDISTSYMFKKTDPIIFVNITGNINAGDINVAVEVLRNISSLVKTPAPETVYKNVNIWVGTSGFATPSNIKHAEITFRVPRSWIGANNIDPGSITMMRYAGSWQLLPTQKINENAEYLFYESATSSFSPFAVTGKAGSTSEVYPGISGTEAQQKETNKSDGTEVSEPGNTVNLNKILVLSLIVGIVVFSIMFFKSRKAG